MIALGKIVTARGMSHPLLYEVNARQWLSALRAKHGVHVDLGSIPEEEFSDLKRFGFTHLWLMGVWPTGPKSRGQALEHGDLRRAYGEALPGWTEADILGSPYAVQEVRVASILGGDAALAVFRKRLAEIGIGLILDFVPNHLGLDHDWLSSKPSHFVSQESEFPFSFALGSGSERRFVAHGKDPYFPGWTDTVQIEYRRRETREAMIGMLASIASKCDGVRCDMAMLLLSGVFERTWSHVPLHGESAPGEFWGEAICAIRKQRPGFLFLAEAYWDLEGALCELGFDYAYDKKLYDFLVHDHWGGVQPHLLGLGLQNEKRAHFLENHDEPRIAGLVDLERHRASLVLAMGLPGMRFIHDGQMEGARRFARVQLGRRAEEAVDERIRGLYEGVMVGFAESEVGRGEGRILIPKRAWEDNPTAQFMTVVEWKSRNGGRGGELVVVNLAPHRSQCRVWLGLEGIGEGRWLLRDRLGSERWEREGRELVESGLYLDLPARGAQLFALSLLSEVAGN